MCALKNIVKELPCYVGRRVRERRNKLGLNLVDIATRLAIAPQQLQKYESALAMIPAHRLYEIGCLFGVSVDYFFDGFKNVTQYTDDLASGVNHANRSHTLNVLLIEDDDSDAYLTRKVSESSSVSVNMLVMSDYRDVFRFLRNQTTQVRFPRPDLIVLDLNLPKMGGLSILRMLKQDSMLSDIPVVILSNSMSNHDMVSCYTNHAAGFMCKPFDFDVFKQKFELLARYWAHTVVLPNKHRQTLMEQHLKKTNPPVINHPNEE